MIVQFLRWAMHLSTADRVLEISRFDFLVLSSRVLSRDRVRGVVAAVQVCGDLHVQALSVSLPGVVRPARFRAVPGRNIRPIDQDDTALDGFFQGDPGEAAGLFDQRNDAAINPRDGGLRDAVQVRDRGLVKVLPQQQQSHDDLLAQVQHGRVSR
nr:hypothetical protein [Rathayibacter rathayi]